LVPRSGRRILHRPGIQARLLQRGLTVPKTTAAVRRLQRSLAGVMLLVALVLPAGFAQAQATVFRFSETHTEELTTALEGCLPEELIGTGTLTETSTGQVVDTGKVFTVRGVNEYDLHLVFPDGSYVQSGLNRDRYVFVANAPLTVYNVVTQDFRTIYAADGTPIGTLAIHAGMHITYRDLNGNGMPDPGEITAQFEYFHLRCG
jgi:hypothetical protein